jgi:pimeloyl-ACP methyl ester carboxylesterase
MRKHGLVITLIAGLVGAAVTAVVPSMPADAASNVVEHRVTFTVINSNNSDLPCPSDGKTYEIRGILAGPRSAFNAPLPRTVSLYLHGLSFGGKYLFSFPDTSQYTGYNWAAELAKRGHVSLSIDRLGYDESGHPDGQQTCIGSAADQTHQIIQALRDGKYTVEGGMAVGFQKVFLVGHDIAGAVAEVLAYSGLSKSDIDGLVVWGYAESGYSQWVLQRLPDRTAFCASGGEAAENSDPTGPRGYFWWPATDREVQEGVGMYMDPNVLADALKVRNRNPCGDLYSTAETSSSNTAVNRLGDIKVPVLLIFEDHDVIYDDPTTGEQQKARFTGSDDVTLVNLKDAGHFPMLEINRNKYQRLVSDWLDAHRD